MLPIPVTFLCPEPSHQVEAFDPDTDWQWFGSGLRAWIAQTYLRLRSAGLQIHLSPEVPKEGIVVYHSGYSEPIAAIPPSARGPLILVRVRADRGPDATADFEIVQNGCCVDHRVFWLPHWPQPGMLPRDPARGPRVSVVAFKGHLDELNPELRQEDWRSQLEAHDLEWVVDAIAYQGDDTDYSSVAWNDFRRVDILLGFRPDARSLSIIKPATKLQNAWLAGVPAVLGPEYPYRELRQSPLDYLEITDAETALRAICRLRDDPELYRQMVQHGAQRARQFSPERVVEAWRHLLTQTLPQALSRGTVRRRRKVPLPLLEAAGGLLERSRRIRGRLKTL